MIKSSASLINSNSSRHLCREGKALYIQPNFIRQLTDKFHQPKGQVNKFIAIKKCKLLFACFEKCLKCCINKTVFMQKRCLWNENKFMIIQYRIINLNHSAFSSSTKSSRTGRKQSITLHSVIALAE